MASPNEIERSRADRAARRRGCYWLLAPGLLRRCGKLPRPIVTCPACGGGVKPKPLDRWALLSLLHFFRGHVCRYADACGDALRGLPPAERTERAIEACPLCDRAIDARLQLGKRYSAGLVWLPKAESRVQRENAARAVTTSDGSVMWPLVEYPDGIEIPETIVLVGDRDAFRHADGTATAAIVATFRPTRLVYETGVGDSHRRLSNVRSRGVEIFTLGLPAEESDRTHGSDSSSVEK